MLEKLKFNFGNTIYWRYDIKQDKVKTINY